VLEVCIVQFFYLIYVLILFNGVDDVMLRNSYRLSIRGLARMDALSTNVLAQECLKCRNVCHILTADDIILALWLIRPQDFYV
jgi:hypothetical protein